MPHLIRRRGARGRRLRLPRRRYLAVAALALIIAAYGGFALLLGSSSSLLPGNGVHAPGALAGLPGLPAAQPTSRINILVLGIDHRPGKGNEYLPSTPGQPDDPGRSDTMALFSADPVTKTAAILSIPRDLWVQVPDGRGGWTIDRLNEAYHTGETAHLSGGGGEAAAAAVTHNFGIPVDYYVALDFAGFTSLVDALGGIDIEVPERLTATVLPKANSGGYEYTFFAGGQHLSGELALAYSRFRLDSAGDLGRIQRQQAVVLAARQRALSLGWIDHPLKVWNKYDSAVQTDIPTYKLPGYALLGKQVEGRGIVTRSLGESGATTETIIPGSGADVLQPNPAAIARIISETFGDPALGATALARLRQLYPENRVAALSPPATGPSIPPPP